MTLSDYLVRENTVAIADIDTRKLTRLLRTKGAQNGCILSLAAGEQGQQVPQEVGKGGQEGGDIGPAGGFQHFFDHEIGQGPIDVIAAEIGIAAVTEETGRQPR